MSLSKRLARLEAQAGTLADVEAAQRLAAYFNPPIDTATATWLDSLSDESMVSLMFSLLAALPDRPPTPDGHYTSCWCRPCQAARDWEGIRRLTEAEKAAWLANPYNVDPVWPGKSPLGVGNRGMAGDYVELQIARLAAYAGRMGMDL